MAVMTKALRATVVQPRPWRWSVRQYFDLIHSGKLPEDAAVELLEGEIVEKMSKNHRHTYAKRLLQRAIDRLITGRYFTNEQEPITLSDSVPEPDLSVVRGCEESLLVAHPTGAEVPLVAEIADASLFHDRNRKRKIYARARIPAYWIINLIDQQVEVYSQPTQSRNADYQACEIFRAGDRVPVVIDGKTIGRIKVVDLLPSSK